MRADDLVRIRHIIDAAKEALTFVEGRTRADLDRDRMLALSLVREVEVIGEAASRVTPETRQSIPGVPWSAMVLMRNRLIHGYFDIDLDILWQTTTQELPPLLAVLSESVESDDNG